MSTSDQQLHLHTDALQTYGCAEVAQEKVSSVKERPALHYLLARLRPGDTLVVWQLDRLGRSRKDLITLVTRFQDKDTHLVSLQDHLDTTAQGQLMFSLFASRAEFERDIICEPTKAGLAAARARSRQDGQPNGLQRSLVQSPGGQNRRENYPAARGWSGNHLPLPVAAGRTDGHAGGAKSTLIPAW